MFFILTLVSASLLNCKYHIFTYLPTIKNRIIVEQNLRAIVMT